MSQIKHLARLTTGHEAAISWVNQQLSAFGLLIRPSFDLQEAKSAHTGCTCPHHGTAQCDCQIVVLLVYGEQDAPITLLVHSQDGKTDLSMTGFFNPGEGNSLPGKIIEALGYQNIEILMNRNRSKQ